MFGDKRLKKKITELETRIKLVRNGEKVALARNEQLEKEIAELRDIVQRQHALGGVHPMAKYDLVDNQDHNQKRRKEDGDGLLTAAVIMTALDDGDEQISDETDLSDILLEGTLIDTSGVDEVLRVEDDANAQQANDVLADVASEVRGRPAPESGNGHTGDLSRHQPQSDPEPSRASASGYGGGSDSFSSSSSDSGGGGGGCD